MQGSSKKTFRGLKSNEISQKQLAATGIIPVCIKYHNYQCNFLILFRSIKDDHVFARMRKVSKCSLRSFNIKYHSQCLFHRKLCPSDLSYNKPSDTVL